MEPLLQNSIATTKLLLRQSNKFHKWDHCDILSTGAETLSSMDYIHDNILNTCKSRNIELQKENDKLKKEIEKIGLFDRALLDELKTKEPNLFTSKKTELTLEMEYQQDTPKQDVPVIKKDEDIKENKKIKKCIVM